MITQETGQALIRELTSSGGDVRGYFASMIELRDAEAGSLVAGDSRSNDQNANLYERDWQAIIEDNFIITNFIFSSDRKR